MTARALETAMTAHGGTAQAQGRSPIPSPSHAARPRTVLTFGTFDLFHVGHLRILERAAALGDRLIVGVSTDELNFSKKGRYPFVPEEDRMAIVAALRCVAGVFREHSLAEKRAYLLEHKADVLVMGHDWSGRFDEFQDICQVVYLPRTESVSTTEIEALIRNRPSPRHQVRPPNKPGA